MKKLGLPDNGQTHPLIYYLAVEEYVACHLKDDVFFLWQAGPTVISGRNQVLAAESDLNFCREHGIDVVRRKSGGGTVYSDMGNIMVSCTVACLDVPYAFDRYLQRAALFLRSIGVDAEVSGRNDIIVRGRKVSGNAFYKIGDRGIIHGTMLFDMDFCTMEKALTPSFEKISGKGIKSVRQRVANISEFTNLNINEFKKRFEDFFCDGTINPGLGFDSQVSSIMNTYLDENFLRHHEPEHRIATENRTRAGNIEVQCEVKGGKIRKISFNGDFFPLCENPDSEISTVLSGCDFSVDAVSNSLPSDLPGKIIRNLDKETLIKLIFNMNF